MPGPVLLVQVAARAADVGVSATTSAKPIRRFRTLPTTRLTRERSARYEEVAKGCLLLLPAMPDEPGLERAFVQAREAFRHGRSHERGVRDREQLLRDEPHFFLGGHPFQIVETRKIHRTRERAQRSVAPEIEIGVEVAHHQLAQRAMD